LTITMASFSHTVTAQSSGSTNAPTSQRYQIVVGGTPPSPLTYDANGNTLTDENGNTYQWDAVNRLTKITYPSGASSNFAYDGLSRRISIIEKNSGGSVTSTKNYLWIGQEIAEERDGSNNVTKRFFSQGEQQSGTNYYYTYDHLWSTREMLNSSGSIVARYAYDPYGRAPAGQTTNLVSGTNLATFQYASYYAHQSSGLYFTLNIPGFDGRAYDASTGRWLSRDSIEEAGGLNLYDYVGNDPIDFYDEFGLHWEYNQSTGQMTYVDDQTGARTPMGNGYSGNHAGMNNPDAEHVHGIGPLPQGTYTVGPAGNHIGPVSMHLTPSPTNDMTNRDPNSFLIHGDNPQQNHTASDGCIILPRAVRTQINSSTDRTLVVVPGRAPVPGPQAPQPPAPAPAAPAAPPPHH